MTKSNNKDIVDSVIYNYTTDMSDLEKENRILRSVIENLKNEVNKFRTPPLIVCEVSQVIKDQAVVKMANGNQFLVNIDENCPKLNPGDSVLAEQKNLTVIKKTTTSKKFNVEKYVIIDKPDIRWEDVGGLDFERNEIQEVIELPLKNPKLFEKVGIIPPKGILLHGPPGTGKTLLAKAVASSTNSTFIEVVGSELVQKFIGEGAKLVKEMFDLAKDNAPTIIFIDEIDALASVRMDIGTSGEREVQRTFMQLLAEIDGFKNLDNVKVIGCTNRKDILDPAVTRPGRLDRLIEIPLPKKEARAEIFKIHTKRMKLEKKINLEEIIKRLKDFSGAEIKAVCTEAGYFAIREKRTKISQKDFFDAIKKVKEAEKREGEGYLKMFG